MCSDWEYVKLILREYTVIFVPNLGYYRGILVYIDVLRWTISKTRRGNAKIHR
jgi:hypothetical protein